MPILFIVAIQTIKEQSVRLGEILAHFDPVSNYNRKQIGLYLVVAQDHLNTYAGKIILPEAGELGFVWIQGSDFNLK
jgi:hypothetical protein